MLKYALVLISLTAVLIDFGQRNPQLKQQLHLSVRASPIS
jgi:hypothetical protein